MRKRQKTGMRKDVAIVAVVLGVAAMSFVSPQRPASAPATGTAQLPMSPESLAVQNVVLSFGQRLKMVSLTAPKPALVAAIRENYGDLVLPDLLATWLADPSEAPGRLTSSPWPERIEVSSLTPMNSGIYAVKGSVIELSSVEFSQSMGVAATYPIAAIVANENGSWRIADWSDALRR